MRDPRAAPHSTCGTISANCQDSLMRSRPSTKTRQRKRIYIGIAQSPCRQQIPLRVITRAFSMVDRQKLAAMNAIMGLTESEKKSGGGAVTTGGTNLPPSLESARYLPDFRQLMAYSA